MICNFLFILSGHHRAKLHHFLRRDSIFSENWKSMIEMNRRVVVCDRRGEFGCQTLQAFSPNNTPAIFGLYNHSAASQQKATTALHAMDNHARNQSILTWRCLSNQQQLASSETSTLVIPWCDDTLFTAWLNFLSGQSNLQAQVRWFFPVNAAADFQESIQLWADALAHLWQRPGQRADVAQLAKKLYCCRSKLKKHCQLLFNTSPGNLLRLLWVFEHTAWCIQQEQMMGRKRRSPINEIPGNFCRIFKTVTGIGYRSFLQQSQNEHWVAVWMRHWRENSRDVKVKPIFP